MREQDLVLALFPYFSYEVVTTVQQHDPHKLSLLKRLWYELC